MFDQLDPLAKAIDEWQPVDCSSEKQYQTSLTARLKELFPKAHLTVDYGIGDGKVDIGIKLDGFLASDLVLIELKFNLKKSECQRLVGQIQEYASHGDALFIVLCGETDNKHLATIKETAEKKYFWKGVFSPPDIRSILRNRFCRVFMKKAEAPEP